GRNATKGLRRGGASQRPAPCALRPTPYPLCPCYLAPRLNRYLRIEGNVSLFEELHLSPVLAGRLEDWSWDASQREVREAAATAARGNNLALLAPPTPAWATPALAGVMSRPEARTCLLLAPDAELAEWAALAHRLAAGTDWRVLAAQGEARAVRLLLAGRVDMLLATPAMA